jgi:hypothetical protein
LAGIEVGSGSVKRIKIYFITLLGILMVVAIALLITILRLNRLRVRFQTGSPVEAVPVEGTEGQALLGDGEGRVEGTFDVGRKAG